LLAKAPVKESVTSEDTIVVVAKQDQNLLATTKSVDEVKLDDSKPMNLNLNNTIAQPILFEYDKDNLNMEMLQLSETNIQNLKTQVKGKKIILEGNADERGSDEYNYALGLKRANAVKIQLVKAGVDESTITIKSYGESNPKCTESVESCWRQNRRVDYVIYK